MLLSLKHSSSYSRTGEVETLFAIISCWTSHCLYLRYHRSLVLLYRPSFTYVVLPLRLLGYIWFCLGMDALFLYFLLFLGFNALCESNWHVILTLFRVQYYDKITKQDTPQILFLIVRIAYFPNAAFFSHHAYKTFKQYAFFNRSRGNSYEMVPVSSRNNNSYGQTGNMNNSYQAPSLRDEISVSRGFVAFQGQGMMIGWLIFTNH